MIQATRVDNLITALEAERTRRDLDHRGFSTLLGIHESYWHRIRTGERAPNLNILTLVIQKFPDLAPAVTEYIMRQGDGENPSPMTQNPVASDTSPKKAAKTGVGNKAVRGNTSTDPKQQRKT